MPNMTLDHLAALTQQEFQIVHGRLDKLEQRMGKLEHRMDALEGRMDGLEQRMERLEQRMDRLETHLTEMFMEMRDMIRGFAYAKEIDDLRGRVTNIEKKIGM